MLLQISRAMLSTVVQQGSVIFITKFVPKCGRDWLVDWSVTCQLAALLIDHIWI